MLQAYIHSRMRRRTADFLQGEYLDYCLGSGKMLNRRSTQQSETGERGERAKDSKRSNIQSSGMSIQIVHHGLRKGRSTATWQYSCFLNIRCQSHLYLSHFILAWFYILWGFQSPGPWRLARDPSFSSSPTTQPSYISPLTLDRIRPPSLPRTPSQAPISTFGTQRLVSATTFLHTPWRSPCCIDPFYRRRLSRVYVGRSL